MSLPFEWDPRKARENLVKHGGSFGEASSMFGDPLSITIHDPDHSETENRLITLGVSSKARLLIVVHSQRDIRLRLISARKASRMEKKQYEES
ncbi:MAG: BrnT family toxin [Candidatus Solibacter usitatus]|nr:BrnT family toxin [Candidatus Solibacter usitatus]